jgi:hypothetical protein
MDGNEKLIEDIKNLIKFYEGLGQTNTQLATYVSKLHEELAKLTNEQNETNG